MIDMILCKHVGERVFGEIEYLISHVLKENIGPIHPVGRKSLLKSLFLRKTHGKSTSELNIF